MPRLGAGAGGRRRRGGIAAITKTIQARHEPEVDHLDGFQEVYTTTCCLKCPVQQWPKNDATVRTELYTYEPILLYF